MSKGTPLCELFSVRSRFGRAVNIETDLGRSEALTGYVVTPLVRQLLGRIVTGLRPGAHTRAWSITGPYGAGKSAAVLLLARVLGYPVDADARGTLTAYDPQALTELCECTPELARGGFSVVPIVASREPVAMALYRGFAAALASDGSQVPEVAECRRQLRNRLSEIQAGQVPFTQVVCDDVRRVGTLLRTTHNGSLGTIIILDELGKLLEYAAQNPRHSDVYLLQALAEMANRSGDQPLAILGILHQSFEQYASRLSRKEQQEWAKVQGRFEDLAFHQPSNELIHIVGSAIERGSLPASLIKVIDGEAHHASQLGLAPRASPGRSEQASLAMCAPLHPTVTAVLDRLFRSRLAQNERSVFAFLTSDEPHGLRDSLSQSCWLGDGHRPFYRLDQLYDYVHTALGSALYTSLWGKRWAEIEDALDRLKPDALTLDARLIKSIGLLSLVGDQALVKASPDVLRLALADGREVTEAMIDEALDRLSNSGIVLFRKHRGAYGLWEGSDIDLDERFESARQHVEQTTALAARVTEVSAVRPYIARRHLHDTGTVRYFAPWIVELDEVDQVATRPFGVADGAVVFVLTEREQDVEAAVNAAKHASSRLPSPRKERTFFAVPTELEGLRESIDELKVWDWVAENTPELAGDAVARRELSARRIEGRQRFNQLCAHCFDPSSSFRSARWVWRGQESPFTTAAQLASAVSDACDAAYAAAPTVQNELVNRSTLSSSAAAARRTLIELMLAHGADPRLGIRGAPPELSMYRSVLEQSGLHHQTSGGWVFGPKEGWDPCRVGKLWAAIERWLDSTEEAKQPVVALFALLREAPYGIRDGLLPIYLVAAALHWEMELAFYEDGTFVPEPNIAVFERLIKSPERFAVQRHRTGPARSYLFERYAALLGERTPEAGQSSLLRAVRPILSLVRHLPAYAQNTKRLSAAAIAVRGALQTAREPAPLLFAALPQALGYRSMNADTDQAQAQAFFKDLREALRELQRAYDALLEEVGEQFMVAMDLARPLEAARALAAQRAAVLQEQVTETRLRAYVGRLCDRTLADREWLESLAAMLVRKAPKSWADDDLLAYGVELAALAAQFKRVEDIMVESGRRVQADQARWLRVAVTEGSGEERKELLSVLPADERDIEAVATELEAALRRKKVPRRVRLAALGELARRAMNEEPSDSKGDANDH